MASESDRELERLFYEFYELDVDARRRRLDRDFAPDDELRQKLEALLAADQASTINGLDLLHRSDQAMNHDLDGNAPTSEQASLPRPGDRHGKYTIMEELGRGGMGVVFKALDTRLARLVAIKWLLSNQRDLVRRFRAEAKATARCRHDNIVVIHEVDECLGHPYIVFEYLEGQTLRQHMRHLGQPLEPESAVNIVIGVVRALACAHDLGIVHRDLKPENIMLLASGSIKVLDFGIAKVMSDAYASTIATGLTESRLTQTQQGAILGTLPYMSPEQWAGATVDARTDIWAVGIIMHELLTGKHPLAPLDIMKLRGVADLDTPLLPGNHSAVYRGSAFDDIIDRCLKKRKERRLGSASQLLEKLEGVARGRRPLHAKRPATKDQQQAIIRLLLEPSPDHDTASSSRLDGLRILIVDDEELVTELLTRFLEGGGAEVWSETRPDRVPEILRQQNFDLVLTDLRMPKIDGMEILHLVRKDYPDMPVIVMSGHVGSEDGVSEIMEAGAAGFIRKPFPRRARLCTYIRGIANDTRGEESLRNIWPDYAITFHVLMRCQTIIRGFLKRYDSLDLFQTALRHKLKECVYSYAQSVQPDEPGEPSATALVGQLQKIDKLMRHVLLGNAKGLVDYMGAMQRDLEHTDPGLGLEVQVLSPVIGLGEFFDIQAALTLSAVELMDNARDAVGPQGQIRIQIREHESTQAISLKLWCNSAPISPELAERIFEEGVSTKGTGRGMGLAIVKAMVTRLQGQVRLLQHDGVTFLVTIPLPDDHDE